MTKEIQQISEWYEDERPILIGDDATGFRAKSIPIELIERIKVALNKNLIVLQSQCVMAGVDFTQYAPCIEIKSILKELGDE